MDRLQSSDSRDHSEECRKRIQTALRSYEELEAKADVQRNVRQDATRKRKVTIKEGRDGRGSWDWHVFIVWGCASWWRDDACL